MANEQLRPTGIGVVGDVPWGTHFFLFHETKEDLMEACVPYFRAGLESGELCIWAIADPLSEEAHRRVMRLHYLRGDRAAALAAFERCRERASVSSRGSMPRTAIFGRAASAWMEGVSHPPKATRRPTRLPKSTA